MFAGVRVSVLMMSSALALGGSMAMAVAQSSGPSTTGGALPYITGSQKPAASPTSDLTPASPLPPRPGVRVIDLSKRDPAGPDERSAAPPLVAAPALPVTDAPKSPTAPTLTPRSTAETFTPPAPQGAEAIAATPPSIDGAPDQATVATPVPPRALADAPRPKAKPKAKVATTKPQPKRTPQATARLERRAPTGDLDVYDQDVEVEIAAPRPLRAGPPRLRFAGYDAWGRPVYYMPTTPARDRRQPRAPRYIDEDWIDAPPAHLRRLPPVGQLRPFPPMGHPDSFWD